MLRVVVDPGVLVSGLISGDGPPAALILAWRDGLVEMVVSPKLLEEVERVLRRPKFRRYVSGDDVDEYVDALRLAVLVPDPPVARIGLTPDPGDDYLVALARAARADVLVSGDVDLTGLRNPDPPVMTPRDLIDRLSES